MKLLNAALTLLLATASFAVKAQNIFDMERDPHWVTVASTDDGHIRIDDERRQREINCLASNIFWESRGEPKKGKIAVGLVTINRVKSGRFANSICGVVSQRKQFSWYRPGKILAQGNSLFQEVRGIAEMLYDDYYVANTYVDFVHGATHFHSTRVNPPWRNKRKIARIGSHLFFRVGY